MRAHVFSTAVGLCGLAWNDTQLTRFWLPEPPSGLELSPPPEWIQTLVARVQRHMTGDLQDFAAVPLDWTQVSAFQRQVYDRTVAIKAGRVRGYGEIAADLGLEPGGARAVGMALGSNPWPLVVPCHRVVAADGRMTGFSSPGGIRMKTRLLAIEGAELLSE